MKFNAVCVQDIHVFNVKSRIISARFLQSNKKESSTRILARHYGGQVSCTTLREASRKERMRLTCSGLGRSNALSSLPPAKCSIKACTCFFQSWSKYTLCSGKSQTAQESISSIIAPATAARFPKNIIETGRHHQHMKGTTRSGSPSVQQIITAATTAASARVKYSTNCKS